MPWISRKDLAGIYDLLKKQSTSIRELGNQLNKQKAQIARLQLSSTAQTYSMGEVDLAKLARKVDEIIRKVENGQLAKMAADRLITDILNAYHKGQQ